MGTQRDEGLREVQTLIDKELNKEQYDPKQSEEIRRELRVQYRNLTEKTIESRRDLIAQDNGEKLYNVLSKSNVLFADVKNTQEAVLDARFLVVASDLNAQKVQAIKIGSDTDVNLDDFVGKVTTYSRSGTEHVEDDTLDWEHIGKLATEFSKRVHTMDFMLGPLAVEQKKIKRTNKARLTKNKEDLVVPAQLQQSDIKEQENETSNNVNNIYQILSEVQPINYFKFVTNPESFSQTVENIFYVSFLVGRSVVQIDVSSGQPVLSLHDPPNVDDLDDVISKKQIIMGIDIKDWKDIISTYNITKSYIPTRALKETVATGKGWY